MADYRHALVIDVRSPDEYAHAQIPGAYSLPLFSNEERKQVGTAYKQESRENAIKIGLKFFGPKMVSIVEQVEAWKQEMQATAKKNGHTHKGEQPTEFPIVVHCWRGGMRSAGIAWLLDLYGFKVYTIRGGYKVFRQWCLQQLEKEYPFKILGGYTGSGKTAVLHQLKKLGENMIDLEGLASHKGSAFGSINMPKQPSQEMFENQLALALHQTGQQGQKAIWLEDESQRIGSINIPTVLFRSMRKADLYFLDIPFAERLNLIVQDYGKGDIEKLVNAIIRIQKRLGGLETKNAIQCLLDQDLEGCFTILLRYYDKRYAKSLELHIEELAKPYCCIASESTNAADNAYRLLQLGQ
ncbi:MAG TPA: tRNA 2-selenouridine(34) synthase MnmH [Phnomibacter sp.]|nr:tRNA 2-selenouridine(34) synthase MnmH [Phnomibacter sp.]